jgi:uncharacterized Ntn-hydrolase superfamily protein
VTYSIVARCPDTGQLGVAVQSHFFGVGAVVPWLEAGVGAVATQATAEIAHGPNGLARLRVGRSPQQALDDILGADPHAATRQVAIVDGQGQAAAHTGASCIADAGHLVGDGFTVQANMMDRAGVPEAMVDAFTSSSGALAGRLLAALDAAEGAGGDIRGQQSAALVVVQGEATEQPGHETLVDVRVEDHPQPLVELRRLVGLSQAYRRMDDAEAAMNDGDLDTGLAIYADSIARAPDQPEFPFWQAVLLAALGRTEEARVSARPVFERPDGDRWRELVRRLPATGVMPADAAAALLGDSPAQM